MHDVLAKMLLIAIVLCSILLMLLRPRRIAEVWWVGTGAALLVLLRLIPLQLAGHAVFQGTDVYLFLIGMMLLSELARENGVFDWLASVAVYAARGSRHRLFTLLYGIGILVTVTMSNDATAVVLTPAVLTAIRRSRVEPLPYLFACAFIANAASFVLPISNPANLVVFRADMPALGHWLAAFLVPAIFSIAATYAVLRWHFSRDLVGTLEAPNDEAALGIHGRLVVAGLALVVVVLLVASALNLPLGLPTCLAAIVITAIVSITSRTNPLPLLRHISWSTLALVAALFIMVNAVESIGALQFARDGLMHLQLLGPFVGGTATAVIVAVANNLVNNLPLGLIAGGTLASTHTHGLFASIVLIAVDLGPNLSVTGSLATILWLLALRREKLHVGALDFLRLGAIAMPTALIASLAGLFLMHLCFGLS